MAARKIKLTIQYDGRGYHGWQVQPGLLTVQQVLIDALRSLLNADVEVTGASRTDAGVSALGQCASFITDGPVPTCNIKRALNQRLPEDIVITEAVEVSDDFDVISDVTSKLYRYTINTGLDRPVLKIRHCWHLPIELDTTLMAKAANYLVGKHDFKSFASAADKRNSSVRTILRCDVTRDGDEIFVDTESDGFLYNMVRNIVGTLVETGRGKLDPDTVPEILAARHRTAAGPIAPAQGLCLVWIRYL